MGRRNKEDTLHIRMFEDPKRAVSGERDSRVRHAVACVHVPVRRVPHEGQIPIGLQLPQNAAQKGGLNFSPLQGGVKRQEDLSCAVVREAEEEYFLDRIRIFDIRYLVSTRVSINPESSKASKWDQQWLHWHLLRTERYFKPNPEEVVTFGWMAGPDSVFDAMSTGREEKLVAFATALGVAISQAEVPSEYGFFASLGVLM